MNTIIINGKSICVSGNNVSVVNGTIIVDGKVIEEGLSGIVEVKFEGDLAKLDVKHGSATINGNVQGSVDAGGNVVCGNVGNSVDAGGNVTCRDVKHSVDAGGNVTCGDVGGDIDAGGSVRCGSRK